MKFEVFKRHMSRPTLSVGMVEHVFSGKGQKGAMVEKRKGPWQRNIVKIIVNIFSNHFFGKRRQRQKKTKE